MIAGPETSDVRAEHRFDEAALARFLHGKLPGADGPLYVSQLRGGQSNPTFVLSFGELEYVLRKQPPGVLLPSAHAVEREYRVQHALAQGGVPVAKMHVCCEDKSVIGTSFYVMERMRGRIFRDSRLPEQSPAERALIYDAMNETMATLHRIDFAALGLADFGKPQQYFARQIARWSKQWSLSKQQDIPEIERLIEWLPRNIPEGDEAALCHGDFRLENLMFAPDELRVIAVFDWELSTLGHPLADLAYNVLVYHYPAELGEGLAGVDLTATGIPTEHDYLARYLERTGRSQGIRGFHLAFSCFRLAVILEGVLVRAKAGSAASSDALEVGMRGATFAKLAWSFANQSFANQPFANRGY